MSEVEYTINIQLPSRISYIPPDPLACAFDQLLLSVWKSSLCTVCTQEGTKSYHLVQIILTPPNLQPANTLTPTRPSPMVNSQWHTTIITMLLSVNCAMASVTLWPWRITSLFCCVNRRGVMLSIIWVVCIVIILLSVQWVIMEVGQKWARISIYWSLSLFEIKLLIPGIALFTMSRYLSTTIIQEFARRTKKIHQLAPLTGNLQSIEELQRNRHQIKLQLILIFLRHCKILECASWFSS